MSSQEQNRKISAQTIYKDQLITLQDLDNFKNELLGAIRTLLFNTKQEAGMPQPGKKWLKSYEVKRLLKISNGTLQHLRNSKQLPFSKLGGAMYYDADVIQQLLSARDARPAIPLSFQKTSTKIKKEKVA